MTTPMIKVVQWATGAVGGAQLRAVIDDPDLDLVGLFVYSPEKVGVDAGTLVDRGPTGVLATNDKREILALDADVVLHAASKGFPVNTNTDDIVELLASGKNVITTTSYNHLPTFGQETAERIDDACRTAGVRFHAAGEHPGFMFERLATSLTGLCQRVDRITVQEFVDCSGLTEPKMLVELMGMGKQPEEISVASPMFRAVSVQYEQATRRRRRHAPTRGRRDPTRDPHRSRRRRHAGRVRHAPGRVRRRADPLLERVPRRGTDAGGRGVLDLRPDPRVEPRGRGSVPRAGDRRGRARHHRRSAHRPRADPRFR